MRSLKNCSRRNDELCSHDRVGYRFRCDEQCECNVQDMSSNDEISLAGQWICVPKPGRLAKPTVELTLRLLRSAFTVRNCSEEETCISATFRIIFCIYGGTLVHMTASVISAARREAPIIDVLSKLQREGRSGINLTTSAKLGLEVSKRGPSWWKDRDAIHPVAKYCGGIGDVTN